MIHEFIFNDPPTPECHASTIAETPGGLVAAWFGGTREGADDTAIWCARRDDDGWGAPVQVADGRTPDGARYPCWNPVLHQEPGGPLLLFYKVGPNPRTWWGMSLRSADAGTTWSAPLRLPGNILGPIKNKPLRLAGGDLLCPSSSEGEAIGPNGIRPVWEAFIERTSDGRRTWTVTPALNAWREIAAIQPALIAYPTGRLQMLCRTMQGRIAACWSADGGRTWGKMTLTDLPNPNSGIDAVGLRDGRAALCYNPTSPPLDAWGGPRTPLVVALSDDGETWRDIATLEDAPGEYSYPAIIQTGDGALHITYTWQRTAIKHVAMPLPRPLPKSEGAGTPLPAR